MLTRRIHVKKNILNYHCIVHIFSRDQILIAIWKDQDQHSAIENTVLQTIFVTQNLHHIIDLDII